MGGAAADIHYPSGITVPSSSICPGGTFGKVKGIDSALEVLRHERRHETINHNWNEGGAWNPSSGAPLADSDDPNHPTKYDWPGDDLPDTYETGAGTANNNVDSCNLATYKSPTYANYGDNEFDAIKTSHGATGSASNDWANPGKQTVPAFDVYSYIPEVPEMGFSGPVGENNLYAGLSPYVLATSTLTGVYSSAGVDQDGDGLFNKLKLSVGVNIDLAESYNLVAWIEDSSNTPIAWASRQLQLGVGSQTVDVFFDGTLLRASGLSGPYKIARVELRQGDEEHLVAYADYPHTTAAIAYTKFDPAKVTFGSSFSSQRLDTNTDTQYEWLRFTIPVQVDVAGQYSISADLEAAGLIASKSKTVTLAKGASNVLLDFSGEEIFFSRMNGPYSLARLKIRDASGKVVAFSALAFTTPAFPYNQFEHAGTTINAATYADLGLNVDGDPEFEYLQFTFQINAAAGDNYKLLASLKDQAGNPISEINRNITLVSGVNNVKINFPGGEIYQNGVNGPYQVAYITLLAPSGSLVDHHLNAWTTTAYPFNNFSLPLVALTNSYTEKVTDPDVDGKYDSLEITVGLKLGETGVILAQAQLVDPNGKEIQWIETSAEYTAGGAQKIKLVFSGAAIGKNGRSGPYKLANLIIYNTGDPDQNIFLSTAYTTAAYSYYQFEGAEPILFLPSVQNK